jgi:prolipoprotein diacylglyceryltransferase
VFEAAAPGIALAIAIGQLGAFIDGQGQGLPSDLPWATRYTNPLSAVPDFRLARHPVQIYDGVIACALFMLLARLRPGLRWWSGVVVYGLARIGLGAVRLDPEFLFGLQLEQLLAGCGVGVAVVHLGRYAVTRPSVRKARSESVAA